VPAVHYDKELVILLSYSQYCLLSEADYLFILHRFYGKNYSGFAFKNVHSCS